MHKAMLAAVCALSWGCFEIDQEIKLAKDLSGTAKVAMKLDLEPMIAIMASMRHAFGGDAEGTATKAEINAAKKEILAKYKNDMSPQALAKEKVRLQGDMPDGVEITRFKARVRGTRVTYDMAFSFDDVTKLGAVELDATANGSPAPQNPMSRPFTWRVVDEGETLVIDSVPPNLSAELRQGLKMSGGGVGTEAIEAALAKTRLTSKITVPYPVVESNATKTRGKTLTWSFGAEAFEKMTQGEDPPRIFVRMKKPPGLALGHLTNVETPE
jgi:hypothetical protein